VNVSLIRSIALAACCVGCATPLTASVRLREQPVALSASPSRARLVFVRPDRFVGSAVSAYFVDAATQQVLGKSVNQTVFAVDVEPGAHVLCPVPVFDQAGQRMGPNTAPGQSTRVPPTTVTVEAGHTYLFRVDIQFGEWPRIVALPVRAGTASEAQLVERLGSLRPVELAPKLDDLVTDELPAWIERCRKSADGDVTLVAQPRDGRWSAPGAPPAL
jgi:hypothetical protein